MFVQGADVILKENMKDHRQSFKCLRCGNISTYYPDKDLWDKGCSCCFRALFGEAEVPGA